MTDEAPHAAALLRCARCGRVLPANRVELLGYTRAGLPACCGLEMDLYIQAERPALDDARIVALPLPLPDPEEATAVIPVPQARKGPK